MTAGTDWMTATDGHAEHGPHLPAKLKPSCRPLLWMPPHFPEDRRVELRWTCVCRPVVYVLIRAGGRGYIERRGPEGKVAHTPRMPSAEAGAKWELLLTGRAR